MTEEDNKFLVQVTGGTPEERSKISDRFKTYAESEKVDVDLVKVEEGGGQEMSILIKTPCGETEISGEALKSNENIIETACGKVKCPSGISTVEEPTVSSAEAVPVEGSEEVEAVTSVSEPTSEYVEIEDDVQGDTGKED